VEVTVSIGGEATCDLCAGDSRVVFNGRDEDKANNKPKTELEYAIFHCTLEICEQVCIVILARRVVKWTRARSTRLRRK
jgi:hypothetical protein